MLSQQNHFNGIFHALADPSRRMMLERLSDGPASVGELAKPLAMSLPAVVQHLGVLEGCGLITTHKSGRFRICQLDTKVLRSAEQWISQRRTTMEKNLDRLGAYLDGIEAAGKQEDNHE